MSALLRLVFGGFRSPMRAVHDQVAKQEHRRAERDLGAMQEELGALCDDVEQKIAQNCAEDDRAREDARKLLRTGKRPMALMRLRDARLHRAQVQQLGVVRDTAKQLSMKLETMDTMRQLTRTMTGYNQIRLPPGMSADTVADTAEQAAAQNDALQEVDDALQQLSADMFAASTQRLTAVDDDSELDELLADELAAMEAELREERDRAADWSRLEHATAVATGPSQRRARRSATGARRARRRAREDEQAPEQGTEDEPEAEEQGGEGAAGTAGSRRGGPPSPPSGEAVLEFDVARGEGVLRTPT